jgi:hypothetical protein
VEPGRLDLRLGASMLYATTSHVAECPDLGPECRTATPPTPYNHHVDQLMSDVSLDVSYGIAPWLAAELRLVLRIVDVNPTYSELDGTAKSVPNDIHHHDETLVGPGDPWLVLRAAAASGKVVTGARLGVTLPIGRTEPDPYALGAEGRWHQHLQFGTGTFMPIVGAGVSWASEPVELSLSALALFSVYENSEGFRAPSRFFLSTRATLPLADGAWKPYVSADLTHETEELWAGMEGMEGSTVRTEVLLGGGVSWRFADPWTAELGVRARVAQLTDAASFDYPGLLQIGLSTSFDLGPADPTAAATTAAGTSPADIARQQPAR